MAGIYIHIPFCKKLCFYCDFYHVITRDNNAHFVKALLHEATLRKEYLGSETVSTIYFGGGTPSVLELSDLQNIMTRIRNEYDVDKDCETTIEINPDDATPEFMEGIRKIGINRVSLGVQSWRDADLKVLNRRHDSAGARMALEETFRAGFENVTIDLIYGIPGMSITDWLSNLEYSFSFDIKHLSAYHLTIEKGTVFGKMKEKGLLTEIEEEDSASQFNLLVKKAGEAGFIHYEISNFARDGYFSKQNSNYWKQIPYIGLGPSAHSFNGYSRQWNKSDLAGYIRTIGAGQEFFESEELDVRKRFNEYIITSLRTMWGIDLNFVEKSFEKEGYDYVVSISSKFREYGLMKQEKNNIILTDQGKLISDNIISEFMMPGEEE